MARKSSAEGPIAEVEVQISPILGEIPSVVTLRRAAEATLGAEGVAGQVTLVITDDREIQALNRDFLGIDAPTDVLSFGAQEEAEGFVAAPEVGDYLGDVIISYPRAAAQAAEAGHPVEQELCLLVIHGLLHLLGYDHAREEDRALMWARQNAILAQCTREQQRA